MVTKEGKLSHGFVDFIAKQNNANDYPKYMSDADLKDRALKRGQELAQKSPKASSK